MSGKPAAVAIPRALLEAVYREARRAFPAECCGWLTGARGGGVAETLRAARNAYDPSTHPTASDRTAETAYVIEGAELLELTRGLDGATPALVVYHSHPNGRAYFSDTDRTVATDPWGDGPMLPVQQLIVGIDGARVVHAKLFAWDDDARGFVEVAELDGAAI